MAIQGAEKPGNQVNQGAALGAPYNPNNSMPGAPDFAGQAMQLIGEWMKMLAPPKVEAKEAKAEKTKKEEKEDEVKKSGTTVDAKGADVEGVEPSSTPTAASAARLVADAEALNKAMDTGVYLPDVSTTQFYGNTTDKHEFGSNFGKVEEPKLHLGSEEP